MNMLLSPMLVTPSAAVVALWRVENSRMMLRLPILSQVSSPLVLQILGRCAYRGHV
jgi:hypothetical protein